MSSSKVFARAAMEGASAWATRRWPSATRVVLCSISGYGQTGPYALRAGHDVTYLGYAGVLEPDRHRRRRARIVQRTSDLLGGTMGAVMGIMVALFDAQGGQGRQGGCVDDRRELRTYAIFPLTEVLANGGCGRAARIC